MLQTKTNY